MNKDNLIEFAKEQCEIFPEDSYMGKYLRETLKMLQAEPCGDAKPYEKFKSAKDHICKLAGDYKCWDNRLTHDEALELCKVLEQKPCEDAISREDVIKAVDRHTIDTDDGLCLDEDISIILEGLPSVKPTQRWIPVSERLPEDETCVLTTIKIPNRIARVRSGWYDNDNGGFFHNDNGDVWKATDMEVLAWMPLPEPMKVGEK